MRPIRLIVAALFILGSMAANADPIVFDNGGPTAGQSGIEVTGFGEADNFVLGTGGLIGGAGVYIASFTGDLSAWDGTLDYFIFSGGGGSPGAMLDSGSGQNVAISDTGIPWAFDGNYFLFEFDFQSPFEALPGVDYWFGVHLASDFDCCDGLFWSLSDINPGNGHFSAGGLDNWNDSGFEYDYFLTGATSVPEPGTLALLGIGLFGMGLARRSRKV